MVDETNWAAVTIGKSDYHTIAPLTAAYQNTPAADTKDVSSAYAAVACFAQGATRMAALRAPITAATVISFAAIARATDVE